MVASCSDGPGAIIDAAIVDGRAPDASSGVDAVEADAAAIDAPAAVDAATLDASVPDAATAIDAVESDAAALDAPVAVDAAALDASPPDAAAVVDAGAVVDDAMVVGGPVSTWTAASGLLPDALCVPWTVGDTSTPEQPLLSAGQLTLGNDVDSETLYYIHPEAVLAMPAVLVIEARVRFVSGGSQTPSRSGASISFSVGATDRKNALFIDDGVVFLLSAENTRGPSAAVATTDQVHTYRIEVTLATSAIQVFRDGAPILTGAAFVSTYDVPTAIYFGESSVVAHGTSSWESVTHNALAPSPCP